MLVGASCAGLRPIERAWDMGLAVAIAAALVAGGVWAGVRWAARLARGERASLAYVWGCAAACVGGGVLSQTMTVYDWRGIARVACVDSLVRFSIDMFAHAYEARMWGFWTAAIVLAWAALCGGGALMRRERGGRVAWSSVVGVTALSVSAGVALAAVLGVDHGRVVWVPVAALGAFGVSNAMASARGGVGRLRGTARDRAALERLGVWATGAGAVVCAGCAAQVAHELSRMEAALVSSHPYVHSLAVQRALDMASPSAALVWVLGVAVVGVGVVCAARARVSPRVLRRVSVRRLAWGGVVACAVLGGPAWLWEHQLEAGLRMVDRSANPHTIPLPVESPEAVRLGGERAFLEWTDLQHHGAMCWAKGEWRVCAGDDGATLDADWAWWTLIAPAELPAHRVARPGWFEGAGELSVAASGRLERVLPYALPRQAVTVRVPWVMAPWHGLRDEPSRDRLAQIAELLQHDEPGGVEVFRSVIAEHDGVAWWVDDARRVRLGRLDAPDVALRLHTLSAPHERVLVAVGTTWTVQDLVSICLTLEAAGASCALAQEPPEELLGRRGVHLSDAK